jgi:hypothetical protein
VSRDTAAGSALITIVAWEGVACFTPLPKVTELSRRHPVIAYTLAGAWLAHVFWRVRQAVTEVIEELEECDEWH